VIFSFTVGLLGANEGLYLGRQLNSGRAFFIDLL